MLLSSVGEQVSPRLIETLSAVGLGAPIHGGLPFFGELTTPDKGISQALELLGFTVREAAAETLDRAPFDQLRVLLQEGPAALGPLDMMHLSYNPMRPRQPGADHYVLRMRSMTMEFIFTTQQGSPTSASAGLGNRCRALSSRALSVLGGGHDA
jgi:hypothetical protein